MQKITPFLWFAQDAEEAVRFYVSLFEDSMVESVTPVGDESVPQSRSTVINFQLAGQDFLAIDGGPVEGFAPSSAVSFLVPCETQEEIDHFWNALSAGGRTLQCGWLVDRFGFTWQIVPASLSRMMSDADPERVKRVTKAMLQMTKFDLAEIERAYENL